MNKITFPLSFLLFTVFSHQTYSQENVYQESFELAPSASTYTVQPSFFNDGEQNYFLRTTPAAINGSSGTASLITGQDGSNTIAMEDVDGSGGPCDQETCLTTSSAGIPNPPARPSIEIGQITTKSIDISGHTLTTLKMLVAATGASSYENYNVTVAIGGRPDYVQITYSVDGGSYQQLGLFTGNALGKLSQDTNGDGVGDGTALGAALTEFSFDISGISGSTLQIKVNMSSNASAEEMAIDNLRVRGNPTAPADATAPVFESSTPSSSSITQTGFTLGTDIDEAGTIYYVVVPNDATAPTSANVKAAQASGAGTPLTSANSVVSSGGFSNNFSVTGLSAGTAYDVYAVAQDDEGSPNLQTSPTKIDVTTSAPSSLLVAAIVFLEGAYNGTGLNTGINTSIPTTQPYSINGHSGGSAGSIPPGAVDWVLVELREAGSAAGALNSTKKGSAAGFLMSDGTVKATDGTSNLTVSLSSNTGTDYHVVIYHRNHLSIMSANAVAGSSGTLTIDFTSSSATTFQTTTALVSLSGGKFGMPAGDTNDSGTIDAIDLSTWNTNNGLVYNYSGNGVSDFNLDGVINAVDRNDFHQKNTSKTRQVPST